MEQWRLHLRLLMANDDHPRSVGWLGDCYWGGVADASGCRANRTLAARLYEEVRQLRRCCMSSDDRTF